MKAGLNKKTLKTLYALSRDDRTGFFAPRKEDPEKASLRFLLFCLYYFPDTFFNLPSPALQKSAEFLHHTRTGELGEFLFVGCGGVGKTMLLVAEVSYSILYKNEPLTVYQSAVNNNVYHFIPQVINMIASPDILHDFGFFIQKDMVGLSTTQKKRGQKRMDFTFTNGSRIVASNLFSTVRGLIHSDANISTSKITTLILDDIATSQSSMSVRLKERVESAMLEARRSLAKGNSRTILSGNITKGANYAQEIVKEKSMPFILVPLTRPVLYHMGDKKTHELPKIKETGTNLIDVYKTKEHALAYNKEKEEHLHASWVDRQYSDAGANYLYECECEFFVKGNAIFGEHKGRIDAGGKKTIKGVDVYLYPFNTGENLFCGVDMGGGRHRDYSSFVGLSESGKVGIAFQSNYTPPDTFATIIQEVCDTYADHYTIIVERDAGSGAECIRCLRNIVDDLRIFRERSFDTVKQRPSTSFGWLPTSAKIETITDQTITEYQKIQLNNQDIIKQTQGITWDDLKERDDTLDHHYDYVRALCLAVHARRVNKLLH